MLLAVVVSAAVLCYVHTSPITQAGVRGLDLTAVARAKRTSTITSRVIEECMVVGLEEGTYFYKSRGLGDVCGVFLISQPDQTIQVSFDYLDVDCDVGGLVSFVDGWELGGEVFPSELDVPMAGRFNEICGRLRKKVYTSTGNAAVIQYRVPRRGDGFKITVRYVRNPRPCNILVDETSGVYTLRNHGRRTNCSLTSIFPATVALAQIAVGVHGAPPHHMLETGILSRCDKRGQPDYVQVGGANGLDVAKLQVEDVLCGLDSNPRVRAARVLCGMTTVRLVSSGATENSVTVAVSRMEALEEMPTLMCDLPE